MRPRHRSSWQGECASEMSPVGGSLVSLRRHWDVTELLNSKRRVDYVTGLLCACVCSTSDMNIALRSAAAAIHCHWIPTPSPEPEVLLFIVMYYTL